MKRVLLNYADGAFTTAQKRNATSGLEVGGFDNVAVMGRQHIDAGFAARNQHILSQPRGAGYWLWKPYGILMMLRDHLEDGDVLFYSDSGAHFVHSAAPVIELCRQRRDLPVLLFTLEDHHRNRVWTKRDCFHYMGLDEPAYTDAAQILASFVVVERRPESIAFVAEWLDHAQDARLITDAPNECGLPNHPEFRDHRHDQSILSLLGRRHGVPTLPDISQWGDGRRPAEIPRILQHTRWRA